MGNSNMFAGFETFEVPEAPEGALQVVYGLSVDTVQVVGEATTANPDGLTPATLAQKLAAKFNMPQADLRVFVDGHEVDFSAPIPATAKRLEFRQPSGEKGADPVILPLDEENSVVIHIFHLDSWEYVTLREEEMGKVSLDLLGQIDLRGLEVLKKGRNYVKVGRLWNEVRATRHKLRFDAKVRRQAVGLIPNTDREVEPLTINAILTGYERPLEVRLNGQTLADGSCQLVAGDELTVVLPGRTYQDDFDAWVSDQRWAAKCEFSLQESIRKEKVAARAEELVNIGWAKLRIIGAKLGVKLAGRGRTSEMIVADILVAEFPELPSEEDFVCSWLRENAPEAMTPEQARRFVFEEESSS